MIETVVVLPNSRVGVRSYTKIKSILEINSVERMKDASTKLPLEDLQAKIKDLEDSNSVIDVSVKINWTLGPLYVQRASGEASWPVQ